MSPEEVCLSLWSESQGRTWSQALFFVSVICPLGVVHTRCQGKDRGARSKIWSCAERGGALNRETSAGPGARMVGSGVRAGRVSDSGERW